MVLGFSEFLNHPIIQPKSTFSWDGVLLKTVFYNHLNSTGVFLLCSRGCRWAVTLSCVLVTPPWNTENGLETGVKHDCLRSKTITSDLSDPELFTKPPALTDIKVLELLLKTEGKGTRPQVRPENGGSILGYKG